MNHETVKAPFDWAASNRRAFDLLEKNLDEGRLLRQSFEDDVGAQVAGGVSSRALGRAENGTLKPEAQARLRALIK